MKRRLLHKLKQNKAFTLMETLIVVAVMVVLLGISIIAISNLSTSLKMAELDEHAKIIYLEAQNQLGIMEVEGGLGAFHKDMRETYPDGDVKENLRFLKEIYSEDERLDGYPEGNVEGADKMWEQMCYLKKSDNLSAKLITFDSDIYNNGGSYLIEFNPQTGDVYSVFYWESNDELTYDKILSLESRDRSSRTADRIGYYGGTLAGDLTVGRELGMDATLINGEELYLKVSFTNTEELLSFYHTALNVKVTIEGEKGNKVVFERMDLSNAVHTLDTIDFYMLLDSMQDGMHFDDIVNAGLPNEKKIFPGEKISIKVESYFAHESGLKDESTLWSDDEATGNSLFGNETSENTIIITSLRHMMNLNEQYFNNALFENEKTQIRFSSNIDFNESAYAWEVDQFGKPKYVGYGMAERPISHWTPIKNESLLTNSMVEGKDAAKKYVLQNFNVVAPQKENVEDRKNAGVFAVVENVKISNLYLVDIDVDAQDYANVGALVGLMNGGSINGCGVYLSTEGIVGGVETPFCKMEDTVTGCNHDNEMEHRYDTYKIKGNKNVGGLVGCVTGSVEEITSISNAFAAVKAEAKASNVGGLIGYVEIDSQEQSIMIENSYASGDVVGNTVAGGFIGKVYAGRNADNSYKVNVSSNYATGDVYANQSFGGFLGGSDVASYKDCTSYGEVFDAGVLNAEADVLYSANKVGGFVNREAAGNSNKFVNCVYMTQNGYNTENVLSDPSSVSKKTYGDLLADDTMQAKTYNERLYLQAFPFEALPNQEIHYGNWAEPFVIDTSLVYYERYADSSYGYYCVTTISDNNNIWVLNTLKDEACVEDGYGLLTKYNLEKIDYDLYVGTGDTVTESKDDVGIVTQSMVANGASSNGKFIRLNQQGKLTFYAINGYDEVYGKEGTQTGETFEVSRLYLYQLPYELQCTNRMDVKYFYDRIQITAKAYGSDREVINGLSYLYCPHFAKTAVNPNANATEPIVNYQAAHENPLNIFVRSAKQLNALGRFPYYWNGRGGLENGNDLTYIQETDINFSTYVKKYAGREFDLQAFGKTYSNRPIGDPDLAPNGTQYFNAQFRNTYDGRSNKIIDYCVDGSWINENGVRSHTQFTGLFGEINDATLKNIVMVVSSNPKGKGGLITSSFQIDESTNGRPWENGCTKRAGVGALVGLAYETSSTSNTIENCVASGYTVQYKLLKKSSLEKLGFKGDSTPPLGVAVGGFAGFSMSDISNCAATNNVILNMETEYVRDGQGTVFLGGFAGSHFYGTVSNCYSGGTISFEDNIATNNNPLVNVDRFQHNIGRLRVGTFCPGWMDTPADGLVWYSNFWTDYGKTKVMYGGVYSFTEVSMDVWDIQEVNKNGSVSTFTHYVPLISRLVATERYEEFGFLDELIDWIGEEEWSTSYAPGIGLRADGTYCITDIVNKHMNKVPSGSGNKPRMYYQENSKYVAALGQIVKSGNVAYTISAAELEKLKAVSSASSDFKFDFSHDASKTYLDGDLNLSQVNYPYPEFIYEVDEQGKATNNYVHYGEWPGSGEWVTKNYPTYYEKYKDGSYAFYYLLPNGNLVMPEKENLSQEIVETGYGVLALDRKEANTPEVTISLPGNNAGQKFTYYLNTYTVKDLVGDKENNFDLKYVEIPYNYTKVSVENGMVNFDTEKTIIGSINTLYVNPLYGVALSGNDELGSIDNPLQVRTIQQLRNVSKTNAPDTVIKLTRDIDFDGSSSLVDLNSGVTFNGNADENYIIKNASTAVFGTNNGTITNTRVEATVNADKAYGFVGDNNGTISYSLVTGSVTGKIEAAGFVGKNTGAINNCYVNAQVSATNEDGKSAGFAVSSTNSENSALIQNSYAVGTVKATTTYGFMMSGKANKCYTIVNQDGTTMYGFAESGVATDCYWGYDSFRNYNVEAAKANKGIGTRARLSEIQKEKDYGDDYTAKPDSSSLGTVYPYPSAGLVHYGDWPFATRFNNKIVVAEQNQYPYAGVFYYETYKDEVSEELIYGIYAVGSRSRYGNSNSYVNNVEIINTLMKENPAKIEGSGYGVFFKDELWQLNLSRNGGTWRETSIFGQELEIDGIAEYRFKISDDLNNLSSIRMRYNKAGSTTLYFNMDFNKARSAN